MSGQSQRFEAIADYIEIFISPLFFGYREGYNAHHALLSLLRKVDSPTR